MIKNYIMLSNILLTLWACDLGTPRATNTTSPAGKPYGVPPPSSIPTNIDAVDIAGDSSYMCARSSTNQVKCWGYNLPDLAHATNASGKVFDVREAQFSQISAGPNHYCGILKGPSFDGIPVCSGQKGPWLDVPEEKIKYIAAGLNLTCFIKENDKLGCVGDEITITDASGNKSEIKAADLVKFGVDPISKAEHQDFSQKTFKNVKGALSYYPYACAMGDDDVVYCMGNNRQGIAKSLAQKALDYGIGNDQTLILTDDGKLHIVGMGFSFVPVANLAKPEALKYKKIYTSFSGTRALLTDQGNHYDDGTAMPDNTLVIPAYGITEGVLGFASNRGGPSKTDLWAYCILKDNHKVQCKAFKTGGITQADNPDSLIVKDIPKEIAY